DVVIVDHIVPVITHRFVDRHQPDAIGAEARGAFGIAVVDVVEPRGQAAQISNPVAVRIVEGADKDLVADALAPPGIWVDGPIASDARCSAGRASRESYSERKTYGADSHADYLRTGRQSVDE